MIGKVGIGLVAFSIFISIIFVSTASGFIKPAQSATAAAASNVSQMRIEPAPANGQLASKEALQEQLKGGQYK
jgi:hypothetical protein